MKIGLVDIGGGMKGMYGAGVTDAFLDEGVRFDLCVGVSAGAANIASFTAGQRGRDYRFFARYSQRQEYMSPKNFLKNGNYFDLGYIYGELSAPDGEDPYDAEASLSGPCDFEFVATDALTGEPEYFGKDALREYGTKLLMASSAIPVLCRPVNVGGREYFDGGVSDPIPAARAFSLGCDFVAVIDANPPDMVKQPERPKAVYAEVLKKYPAIVGRLEKRHELFNSEKEFCVKAQNEGRALILNPSEDPGVSTATRDADRLDALYNIGLKDGHAAARVIKMKTEEAK